MALAGRGREETSEPLSFIIPVFPLVYSHRWTVLLCDIRVRIDKREILKGGNDNGSRYLFRNISYRIGRCGGVFLFLVAAIHDSLYFLDYYFPTGQIRIIKRKLNGLLGNIGIQPVHTAFGFLARSFLAEMDRKY